MPPEDATSVVPSEQPPQFRLERFAVRRALFEEVERIPPPEGERRPRRVTLNLQVNTSITMNPESMRAIVMLDVHVMPDLQWQPYRIEVKVSGGFVGENVTIQQFDQFCKIGVPPILFPYVREIVHRLTMDAVFGSVRIDPINIADLVSKSPWVAEAMNPTEP